MSDQSGTTLAIPSLDGVLAKLQQLAAHNEELKGLAPDLSKVDDFLKKLPAVLVQIEAGTEEAITIYQTLAPVIRALTALVPK
ncbi:MAG TPA: hypothetical protein VFF88_00150 [Methylocella sp.]|jgi:hypothetical protein|nr:hypothetical protein [Methylocella sp.]